LGEIRVASPCSADWEQMVGDDRVRFCSHCNLNVFNFSEMTTVEVETLVGTTQGRLCGRFYRRADGTMLTQDCPIGFRARFTKASRVAGASLSAAMGLSFAAAQPSQATNSSLVQIETASEGIEIEILDPSTAVISGVTVRVVDAAGQSRVNAVTNKMGRVQVSGLPAGQYNVEASAPGFRTSNEMITLSKNGGARIRLTLNLMATMGEIIIVDGNFGPTLLWPRSTDFSPLQFCTLSPQSRRLRRAPAIDSVTSYPPSNTNLAASRGFLRRV
jgi:hypothetical protein